MFLFIFISSCSVLYAEETSARAVRFSPLPLPFSLIPQVSYGLGARSQNNIGEGGSLG